MTTEIDSVRIRNNAHDTKEYVATGYNNHKNAISQTQHCFNREILSEKKHLVSYSSSSLFCSIYLIYHFIVCEVVLYQVTPLPTWQ